MARFAAGLTCFLLLLCTVLSDHVKTKPENEVQEAVAAEKNTNPPGNFISQLGNFILDVDEAVWKQTEPLRKLEERLVEQAFKGSIKPASEYISRVRGNYRDLQNRIGNMLLNPIGNPASGNVASSGENKKPSIDNLMPFLPERSPEDSLNGKREQKSVNYGYDETDKETLTQDETAFPKISIPNFDGKFSVAGTVVRLHGKDSGASFHITQDQQYSNSNEKQVLHKRSGEHVSDISDEIEDFTASETNADTFDQLFSDYEERERPSSHPEEYFGSQTSKIRNSQTPEYEISFNMNPNLARLAGGGNLADGLYSEMVMDKNLRRILRNHVVKFVLDPSLDPGKTIVRKLQTHGILSQDSNQSNKRRESVYRRDYFGRPVQTKSEEFDFRKRFGTRDSSSHSSFNDELEDDDDEYPSSTYYDMINAERMRQELGQVGLNYEDSEYSSFDSEPWSSSRSVILAFTPDGVPLRLGLDSEIENPLKYLRRSLYEAGVFLNVPVDSRRLNPFGKEILQLGAIDDSTIRPLYVDLSDVRQEKALVNSLRRSRQHRYRPYYDEEMTRMDTYY